VAFFLFVSSTVVSGDEDDGKAGDGGAHAENGRSGICDRLTIAASARVFSFAGFMR
jgi:hypothetical protein